MTLLDVGARDAESAELLLDVLDTLAPEVMLRLLNEPAHGPLHEALTATDPGPKRHASTACYGALGA